MIIFYMSEKDLNIMLETAKKVMKNSYSPYSKYQVGAALIADDGQLFEGTNMENSSFSMGICAESSAIVSMISTGARKIKALLVIGSGHELCTPCGACRQRIFEFSTPETLIHLADTSGVKKTLKITELLPYAFGTHHLD